MHVITGTIYMHTATISSRIIHEGATKVSERPAQIIYHRTKRYGSDDSRHASKRMIAQFFGEEIGESPLDCMYGDNSDKVIRQR